MMREDAPDDNANDGPCEAMMQTYVDDSVHASSVFPDETRPGLPDVA